MAAVIEVQGLRYRYEDGTEALKGVDFRLQDRKSTRLNSSNLVISYAVFCLKKKINITSSMLSHISHRSFNLASCRCTISRHPKMPVTCGSYTIIHSSLAIINHTSDFMYLF